jgi:pyruvate dehydrogenase E1 component beta subunit
LNPFHPEELVKSVVKTGRLIVVDGGWSPCGMASEVIASVAEYISPIMIKAPPVRITLPFAPAPTARNLESVYYPNSASIVKEAKRLCS